MEQQRRIEILDLLRGILIILVVLYHLLYDLDGIFGVELPFFRTNAMEIFRQCFVGVLIALAGVSCNLSRSNVKRGTRTILCGLLISAITFLFMPEERIVFGILHFMGTAMLIYGLLESGFRKIPVGIGIILSVILCIITWKLCYGQLGVGNGSISFHVMYPNAVLKYCGFIFGLPANVYSSDYFPIIPNLFLFLFGAFLGRDIRRRKLPQICYRSLCKPLEFIGKHTLLIYMAHQPVVYGVLFVIMKIFG